MMAHACPCFSPAISFLSPSLPSRDSVQDGVAPEAKDNARERVSDVTLMLEEGFKGPKYSVYAFC